LPRKPGQRGRSPKVMGLSRAGALDDVRALWAETHNALMDAWRFPQREQHRSSITFRPGQRQDSHTTRGTKGKGHDGARTPTGEPKAIYQHRTAGGLAANRPALHPGRNEFSRPFNQRRAKERPLWI
jgi:hypothetical protein